MIRKIVGADTETETPIENHCCKNSIEGKSGLSLGNLHTLPEVEVFGVGVAG